MEKNCEREACMYATGSLGNVGFDGVAEAFLAAFEDYGLQLDRDKLRAMLTRRGADLNLSAGAFDGDGRLVSFIVNGIGLYGGVKTAYDTGTGTIKSCRGLGLTDRIFSSWIDVLREAGVKQYLLEVLTDNVPAVKIYTRQGFEITRGFNCYSSTGLGEAPHAVDGLRIVKSSPGQIAELQRFNDFEPSWQNSVESLARAAGNVDCLVALVDGEPVGFGVTESRYGDIAQIAVVPEFRRHGIGTALLHELMGLNKASEVRVVNVDASCSSLNAFLEARGFNLTCTQHEMLKKL